MVKRTCPACGATRYSADDISEWMCECGRWLTPELNEAPEREIEQQIHHAVTMITANPCDKHNVAYWEGYIAGIKAAEKRLTKEEK